MEKEDAIAIVGIACRFPGADDIDEFWNVLKNGEDHVQIIPQERWDTEAINIPNLNDDWKPSANKSGLIKDSDKWDNKFFGISDSEAGWMDPQQCLALEVTYSALEDGGFTKEKLKGTDTGVYIGLMNRDLTFGLGDAAHEFTNFVVTGMASSVVANRISYHFDIRGPSITVDTACSSALVSIHLGSQAIKSGDCDMAICGGVNSILSPMNYIILNKARMISKTGKSHTFSADADGYARGEGCGMVILKNFKKAKEDGDKIWGIVMSGCNQDGKASTPITAPSGEQQKVLLQKIYSSNGISPSKIQYIETHGTGTPIGDPTETNALAEFFSTAQKRNKIPIGSVKTNIGHLESSAGTAGLIKVLLMMKHQTIVPSLHYTEGNGNMGIDFSKIPLVVSTKLSEWHPHVDGTRISCVNSFGFGGTNSHAIIKQIKSSESKADNNNLPYLIVAISATTPDALKNTCHHFLKKLKTDTYDIEDLSYTSILKRDHFKYRLAFAAKSTPDLEQQISSKLGNLEAELRASMKQTNLIFIFCGVGTVWMGMCRQLLKNNKVFKDTVIEVDKEMRKYTKLSMTETLEKPPSDFVTDSFIGPIAIFTCQVGLFRMWKDLGVLPDIIVGQSVGEVAAAYAAGCVTLSEAVKVTYFRTYLSAQSTGGRMLVVRHTDIGKLEELCESFGNALNIAVYSSNETCVVSGDKMAVKQLQEKLSSNLNFPSVLLTELEVTCAYHSPHMTEASKGLEQKLCDLEGKVPSVRIISTVTGKDILGAEMGSAKYWSDNLRNPVLLREGVYTAIDLEKKNIFIEIGPKPILRAHLKNITDAEAETIPSCSSPDDYHTFMKAVAALFKNNIEFSFQKLVPKNRKLTDIPRYKFHRSGNLLASDTVRATLQVNSPGGEQHPFVSRKPLSGQYKVSLSSETTPYIYEHILDHQNIAPGAIHAEIGLAVSKSASSIPISEMSVSLHFVKPLFLGKNHQTVELEVHLTQETNSFNIKRKQEIVCKGTYCKSNAEDSVQVSISTLKRMCPIHVSQQLFYDTLRDLGFEYGPSLTVIGDSWRSDTDYIAELTVPNAIVSEMHTVHLHPCILDGILQTLSISWISTKTQYNDSEIEMFRPIPIKLGALTVKKVPRDKMYVYGRLLKSSIQHTFLNILLLSENGEVIATIENYEVKNVAPGMSFSPFSDISYVTKWLPVEIDDKIGNMLNETDITLCICLSTTAYEIIQKYIDSKSCVMMLLDIPFGSDMDASKSVQTITNTIQNKGIGFSEVKEIIYFPGYRQCSANLDTEEVYHCIKTSGLVLLKLLQKFMEETIDISIYVLTEQTQPLITDIKHKYNLAGSELWGMCRCLARERSYSNIRLVDFTEERDIKLLPSVIAGAKEIDVWKFAPEFKISENKIYVNQIVRSNTDSCGFRMNQYNKKQSLDLKSVSHQHLQKPFFVPKPVLSTTEHTEANYVSLKVETAYVNPIFTPLTETIAVDDPDPWRATRADGHQIISTEVCGHICKGLQICKENSLQCFKSPKIFPTSASQLDISYVTCFPCGVSNTMTVPVRCLIPKTAFGEYRPGLMHEYIWYFGLLEELNTDLPMGVIYEKELQFDLNLLQDILRSKVKVTFMYDINEFRENYNLNGKYQLLLLVQDVSTLLSCSSKVNLAVSRIVAYSQLVSKPQERLLRHQYPSLEICIVNNDDMLSEQKLSKLVKPLTIWLSKKHRLLTKQSWTDNHLHGTVIHFQGDSASTTSFNCDALPVKTDKTCLFNKSSGYIIVGGLTGLGWETVELIAKMGGGCVAIFSRRQPTDQRLAEITEMSEKYNCHIISLRADVSDFESVKKAFETYHAGCHDYPLKGIFHGAAVLDDAIIVSMTEEKFEKVIRPKIKGTLNLHILSKDMKLDYFILHSSITSVLGNSGQLNYGAGNSFMDTFAYYRKSNGLSGQTINWGALHLGLLTASERVERHLNAQGYHSLQPHEIMECLLHTLSNDFTQIVYGIFKWDTIVRQSPDMLHISSKLQPILLELNLINIFTAKQGTKIVVDLVELLKLPRDKLYVKINEILVLIAADLFAVEVSMIQTTTQFTKLGIDSMTGMALINTIYEHLSCKIPILEVLSEEANIESISTLILDQISVSLDVTGMVPVHKMLHIQSEIKGVSINLNFIEQSIYSFASDRKNFSFLRVDMTIMNSDIRESTIENASQELVSLYPELTSMYTEMDGTPFRFVELKEGFDMVGNIFLDHREYVPNKEDVEGFRDTCIREIVDCKSQEEDDIPTPKTVILEGRVFKIVCSREMDTLEVNLYFDRLLFDSISTEQLSLHFVSILDGTNIKHRQEIDYTNIEQELNRAIREHKEDGERFWSSRVSMTIPPVMLSESQFVEKNKTDVEIRTVTLTNEVSTTLKDFNHKNQITNFEFFIGIYQLLLHLISENDIISVASFADLRQFLQRSENTGTMENLIPFITTFQKDKACIQYLLENAENVRDTKKHGIIPFNDMKNMFPNTLSGINAFMHGIFTDKTCDTDFADISTNVKLKPIRSFDSRFQTSLHISESEIPQHIVLSLHYKPQFVQENTASQVLRGLLEIMETILNVKGVTIEQIRKNFNSAQKETIRKAPNGQTNQAYTNEDVDGQQLLLHGGDSQVLSGGETVVLNGKDGIRFKGIFLKETTYGWSHKVTVLVIEDDDHHLVLKWTTGKKTKQMDVNSIVNTKHASLNGMKVVTFQTDTRNYTFKTTVQEELEALVRMVEMQAQTTICV